MTFCDPIIWQSFVKNHSLTREQEEKFVRYGQLLIEWNERINLTAITSPNDIVNYHFADSLSVSSLCSFEGVKSVADVGSGGGFPGIPLAIVRPELRVVLIEVNNKKIMFLREVAAALGLENVQVDARDWRTFLSVAPQSVELFLARASLAPRELIRVFQKNCAYRGATLVYYASKNWEPEEREGRFLCSEHAYRVGDRDRRLIVFQSECETKS